MNTLCPDSLQIYSNVSVKGSKYGSTSVIPSYPLNIETRLPDNTSILTAELSATKEALKLININPTASKRVVLLSDSNDFLLVIDNIHWNAMNTDLGTISDQLISLQNSLIDIKFQHILSHQGIKFNEVANQLASSTLYNPINPNLKAQTSETYPEAEFLQKQSAHSIFIPIKER